MEKTIIKFKNGTTVEAEVNGTCYIADTRPAFPADLSEVTLTENDNERVLHEVEIREAASVDGRYWFSLRELTEQELKNIKTQADIQYIAMMSDIEL